VRAHVHIPCLPALQNPRITLYHPCHICKCRETVNWHPLARLKGSFDALRICTVKLAVTLTGSKLVSADWGGGLSLSDGDYPLLVAGWLMLDYY
jgi:hypothetical protein